MDFVRPQQGNLTPEMDIIIFCSVRQNQSRVSKGLISGIIFLKFNITSSSSSSSSCVIAELFNEGNHLFDLSKFLSYGSGDFDPSATCSRLRIKIIISQGKRMKY